MPEKQRPEIEPHLLNPDHWDGHGPEDDCEWKEVSGRRDDVPFRKELGAPGFGRKILNEMMELGDNPVRTFAPRELFDANQYPEGTVIKYEDEQLRIQSSSGWLMNHPYYKKNRWGVVYGYDYKDERRRTIVSFTVWEDPPYNGFFLWEEL